MAIIFIRNGFDKRNERFQTTEMIMQCNIIKLEDCMVGYLFMHGHDLSPGRIERIYMCIELYKSLQISGRRGVFLVGTNYDIIISK